MTAFFDDPRRAAAWCAERRARGERIGFVPTMGALHDGHLALVRRAAEETDACCVSVFVNPLQFDDPRDYERYPRDLEADRARLADAGVAMVFTGTLETFFDGRIDPTSKTLRPSDLLDPGPTALGLEGEMRPGHFGGVATIVARLFELVAPDRAYFGQKDFQQTLVVRDLVRRVGGPEVVVCPTEREASGLARSSRNELLAPADRERAVVLARALASANDAWNAGERDAERLRGRARERLAAADVDVEYVAVRDPERWAPEDPTGTLERAVILIAVRLGGVRLIDNHVLGAGAPL